MRLHARRVALGATVLALVVYAVACTIADLVVVNHLYGSVDARLSGRLASLHRTLSRPIARSSTATGHVPVATGTGDLDDAPILVWFVPDGATTALRLVAGAPRLPAADLHVNGPIDASIEGRGFRLAGATNRTGRIVVGTSTAGIGGLLSTLVIIEGALAPIALFGLFAAATIIGRRAAAPIERARLRQLEFAADASHELRTPLSVIEAEVGLALARERPALDYRAALARVAGESEKLRHIVDDLLWLARLDSLPAGPDQEPVDVASVARSCGERFQAVAAQRDITMSVVAVGAVAPIIVAPAEYLDRLVSVLLDNACRYCNEAGRIDVSVLGSADRVTLTVDDSGPGFADGQREQLLRRFQRASTVPGGAGLGLAIASAVMEMTRGELKLATAPLGGARVEASWRRERGDERSAPVAPPG